MRHILCVISSRGVSFVGDGPGASAAESEAEVEAVLLDQQDAGLTCLNDAVSGPMVTPGREAYSDTILARRLRDAIARLNRRSPKTREDALRRVLAANRPSLIEENRRLHRAMVRRCQWNIRAEDKLIAEMRAAGGPRTG
ncbi:MAG: hypothetical protein R3D63_02785 [Paracoccaceae bacterium]